MFDLIKKLFKKKNVVKSKQTPAFRSIQRQHKSCYDDFSLSRVIGEATNNAELGAIAGGSLSGGIVGDITNDGCLGSCSESSGSSYSDSCSSYDSGSSCD